MSNINALAQQTNVVAKFEADLHNLVEAMGKADVAILPAGASVAIYKEAPAKSVTYTEGGIIPNSEQTPVLDKTVSLNWDPKRSVATYQKIQTMGFDVAVGGTADKLVKMVGAGVRTALCTAIKSGTVTKESNGTTALSGSTVQAAAAKAAGRLMEVTADEACTPIFFMSPMTFAAYAGAANIQTQEAYGLQYLKGFLGIGNAIVLPGLDDSKVYATGCENINLCAASVAAANGTKDADGVISVSITDQPDYNGYSVVATAGISAFLNVLDRCVIATVGA